MANQLTTNPLRIDTTSATALFTGRLNIRKIQYAGWASTTDSVTVEDQNGNVITVLSANANVSLVETDLPQILQTNGLLVPLLNAAGSTNLQSGVLSIYYI